MEEISAKVATYKRTNDIQKDLSASVFSFVPGALPAEQRWTNFSLSANFTGYFMLLEDF